MERFSGRIELKCFDSFCFIVQHHYDSAARQGQHSIKTRPDKIFSNVVKTADEVKFIIKKKLKFLRKFVNKYGAVREGRDKQKTTNNS